MKNILRTCILGGTCIALVGCASLDEMSDKERTQSEGTAAGAIIGGLLGAAFGDRDSALIGAAVGAGAGYLLGGELAKRKQQYANDEAFLDAEIQRTARLNDEAREYHLQTRRDISNLDRQAKTLRSQYERGEITAKRLKKERKALAERVSEHDQQLAALNKEHQLNVKILEQERTSRGERDPYVARLERENTQLLQQIEQLRGDSIQLAAIDDRLSL